MSHVGPAVLFDLTTAVQLSVRPGVAGQLVLTFLVSFVRLLPLATTSPSLVMTHLVQHSRQSEMKTLARCIAHCELSSYDRPSPDRHFSPRKRIPCLHRYVSDASCCKLPIQQDRAEHVISPQQRPDT